VGHLGLSDETMDKIKEMATKMAEDMVEQDMKKTKGELEKQFPYKISEMFSNS
jgi:polyhydroxyalkanoate synthesis regulator phasin